MNSIKITLSQLEQYLAKAAWILKGPVDASDFKIYIFPLLFFKRISDVYDEEFRQAVNESNGDTEYASLPEFHRFDIPEGCHWNDVRSTTSNVGLAIENHSLSDREKEAHTINFQEMASNDLDVVVIPYPDIVSLKLEKKTFFKPDPKIKLSTPDTDYEFIVSQKVKYKRYAQSLPQILGDKVEVET